MEEAMSDLFSDTERQRIEAVAIAQLKAAAEEAQALRELRKFRIVIQEAA
jgi:hypothetical protein